MPEDIRIWEITEKENLKELKKTKLDLEQRVEKWLEKDISLISSDLLVIGKQVQTSFGGAIDLLCLDNRGDIVIIELKKDKTPREVTAQILDYASWVKDLSNEEINRIANDYLRDKGPLDEAFKKRFEEELPDVLNENHKMLIVASEIDNSSERIIKYLSEQHGVGINAVTFQYFTDENKREFLARVFLIDPFQIEEDGKRTKRKPNLTFEQFQEIAEKNGVGDLFLKLTSGLESIFDYRVTTRSTVGYIGLIDGNRHTIFNIIPGESFSARIASGKNGPPNGLRYQVKMEKLAKYFKSNIENLRKLFPSDQDEIIPWKGAEKNLVGFFRNAEEIDNFLKSLARLKKEK